MYAHLTMGQKYMVIKAYVILMFWLFTLLRPPLFLLDHVWHRNFRVLLKHAGHQAVASDVIDALKQRAEKAGLKNITFTVQFKLPHWTSDPTASNIQAHLANITGPRRLFLARWGQEDNGEGLTVRRLHHNFELQVAEALACCIVWKA